AGKKGGPWPPLYPVAGPRCGLVRLPAAHGAEASVEAPVAAVGRQDVEADGRRGEIGPGIRLRADGLTAVLGLAGDGDLGVAGVEATAEAAWAEARAVHRAHAGTAHGPPARTAHRAGRGPAGARPILRVDRRGCDRGERGGQDQGGANRTNQG